VQVSFDISQKTLERLEWAQVLERLAEHARTPQARQEILGGDTDALPGGAIFSPDAAGMRKRLSETREALALLAGTPAPLSGASDLSQSLARVRKGGALDIEALRRVASTLGALHAAARFLGERADEAPHLAAVADRIAPNAVLRTEIERSIDESGEVREDASSALAEARRDSRRLSGEIQGHVDRLLGSPEVRSHLSDNWATLRNDRYVLPVRADSRGAVPGIVHDASRSGTTLFIEPQALVDLNNRHKRAELAAAREVRRVLGELSAAVADAADEIEEGLTLLVHIDIAFARAHYALDLDAVEPEVGDEAQIALPLLRHPLIPPEESVANDLHIGRDFHVLVLSGPNAGGKTVAMKAAALAVLFARCGLFVPAAAPARIDVFDALLADIGDTQNIEEHLSTFSGHMANVAQITSRADTRSLVVLDEIGTGTDPGEGAALAQATLEVLADVGARTIATTHYGLLKEMAAVDLRFANASVEFDPETLAPTYRLRMGLPGTSSASAVAARMGMPRTVLERADALLSHEDRRLDRMLSELAASRATLEREQQEAKRVRAEGDAARREYSTKLEKLRERRERLYREMRGDLDRSFRDAHAEIAGVVRELQRANTSQQAAKVRTELLEMEARTRETVEPREREEPAVAPVDWNRARPGDAITVPGGGGATLLALPDKKGRVSVRVGSVKLVVPMERVGAATPGSPPGTPRAAAPTPALTAGGTKRCDLRGLRADEARDRLDAALDAAAAAGCERLEIVHGLGTGALRRVVREHLDATGYVTGVLDAEPDRGGDGVTIALLSA